MLTEEKAKELIIDHEATFFRGEMAIADPKNYTLDELRDISLDMELSTTEMEEAMHEDFQSMTPEAQAAMFKLLCGTNTESVAFWEQVLDYHVA